MQLENVQLEGYVFIGIPRPGRVKKIFELLEHGRELISFIVPECCVDEIESIKEQSIGYVHDVEFIRGITRDQIENQVDVFDCTIDVIVELFSKIRSRKQIKGIILSCEAAVYPVAFIRTMFNIPGLQKEQAVLFRDKCKMKERIALQKFQKNYFIRLPKYFLLETNDHEVISEKLRSEGIGFPLILKPCSYGGAMGVNLITNPKELQKAIDSKGNTPYEIEEYLPYEIIHSNGVVSEGKIVFISNYHYNDTPLNFGCKGKNAIAHIEISDELLNQKILMCANEVISRLQMNEGVFHLELFLDDNKNLIFLEIAARPPGVGAVPIMEIATGINLQTISYLVDMNKFCWENYSQIHQTPKPKNKYYGIYVAPFCYDVPVQILQIDLSKMKKVSIEKLFLPNVGDTLTPKINYDLGMIAFSGCSSASLFQQYHEIHDQYTVVVKTICDADVNFQLCFQTLYSKLGLEVQNFGNIVFVYANSNAANFNLIFNFNHPSQRQSNSIDLQNVLSDASSKLNPCLLISDNIDERSKILLGKFNFKILEQKVTCVSYKHQKSCPKNNTMQKQDYQVREAKNLCMLEEAAVVMAEAFAVPIQDVKKVFVSPYFLNDDSLHKIFVIYKNNQAVATTMLYLPEDKSQAAGHYCWATKSSYRNQGIMIYSVQEMVSLVQSMGYKKSVAQCYESSLNLAKKIGFVSDGLLTVYHNL